MRDGRTVVLYRAGGAAVSACEFFTRPSTGLAAGLITRGGRVIRCQDERRGLYYFQDTKESLYRAKPPPDGPPGQFGNATTR